MTEAFLLGIGPYHDNIKDILDYPPYFYDDVDTGAIVTSRIFICKSTSKAEQIANLLGISYNWDFGEHHINNFQAKVLLEEGICDNVPSTHLEFEEDVKMFDMLTRYGFDWQWMPGG